MRLTINKCNNTIGGLVPGQVFILDENRFTFFMKVNNVPVNCVALNGPCKGGLYYYNPNTPIQICQMDIIDD